MRKWIIFFLAVLTCAVTGYAQPTEQTEPAEQPQMQQGGDKGKHIPKTMIAEMPAGMLLKENDGYLKESDEKPKCPEESGVSALHLGPDLGSHEPADMPLYVKHYHEGFKDKKSRVEIWKSVIPDRTMRVQYCYYADPANDYILISLGEAQATMK